MYSSFEAWLRAFNVKLKLHMFQSILDVLRMPTVETYAQRKIQTLQRLCIKHHTDTNLCIMNANEAHLILKSRIYCISY